MHPIEAVYLFPLEEGAAVCGFEAIIDGTLIVGEVKEREDAFRAYDEAIERGDGAFLLDEERPDVFQASVGNLPPGKEVLLKVTYVTELTVAGKGLRFSIPTTVSPRYAPAADHLGVGRPDSDTLNPPIAWTVPYRLNLTVQLAMAGAITRVESPSHPASVAMNGHSATVALSQRDAPLDRDFGTVGRVRRPRHAAGLDRARRQRRSGGRRGVRPSAPSRDNAVRRDVPRRPIRFDGGHVDRRSPQRAAVVPPLDDPRLHVQHRRLRVQVSGPLPARTCLRRDEPRRGDRARQRSSRQPRRDGNSAGAAIRARAATPGRTFTAGCCADRWAGDEHRCSAGAGESHAAHSRISTFGIGAGSSQHLVNGLARAGGGSTEFIYPGERIEPKVVRQFARLLSPALTDVRASWGGLDATQAPAVIPPVFAGGRLLLYAFVKEVSTGRTPAKVQLTATSPSGPVTFDVEFDPSRIVDGRTVATLAARARIRELEESPEWTSARGSRQRERKATGVSREIVELSLRYGLISRETSFVAIERRETPVVGDMQLRPVPIALTAGWAGLEVGFHRGLAMRVGSMMDSSPGALLSRASAVDRGHDDDTGDASSPPMIASPGFSSERLPAAMMRGLQRLRTWGRETRPSEPRLTSGERFATDMIRLVSLQRADGSWELTPELARAIGHDLAELEAALADATGNAEEARTAWATALALAWLEEHARDAEGEWRLLAEKARAWLTGVTARPAPGVSWADAGARLMTAKSG